MPAKSYLEIYVETARSGLPTYPKNTVSPEKRQIYSLKFERRKHELSKVWPGVCKTFVEVLPTWNYFPS